MSPRLMITLFLVFCFPPFLKAWSVDQKSSQFTASNKNIKGSDQSMERATDHAMLGLMHLASRNLTSAISNGYKAYSNYITSEDLDDLAEDNKAKARALNSLDAPATKEPEVVIKGGSDFTSFRRLDKTFLFKGETNKIAAEFEKRTGMSREKFLDVLATFSEQKLAADDPQLVEKVINRFRSFANSIPNPKFRADLNRVISSIPESAQRGLIAKGISQAIAFFAGSGSMPEIPSLGKIEKNTSPTAAEPELTKEYPVNTNTLAVDMSGSSATVTLANNDLPEGDSLNEVFAENPALDDRTIFMIVSGKYKKFWPKILSLK